MVWMDAGMVLRWLSLSRGGSSGALTIPWRELGNGAVAEPFCRLFKHSGGGHFSNVRKKNKHKHC